MTTQVASNDTEGFIPTTTKWVYGFSEGSRDMRELLGGKGAGIAEMTRILGAELVPGGFTSTPGGGAGRREAGARRSRGWRSRPVSGLATPRIHCSCRCAPAHASRCRG